MQQFVSQDWRAGRIREWLLLLLRFAITCDPKDQAAAFAMADEIDALGLEWRPSAPSFFRRTSGEVCAAITVLEDPRRITILEKHIARKSCWQAFFSGHFTAGIAHVGAKSRDRGSNPPVSAKSPVQRAADSDDHADNEKIPIAPFELRHELEVHAVDAGDRGRHREDGGPGR